MNDQHRAPVSGASYRGEDFSARDFSGWDLSDCAFHDCLFIGARFRATDVTRSAFEHCQFNDAESARPADFSQADLREAAFRRCNLTVVDFVRCKGYDLVMENCQLQGADFSKADFRMPFGDTSELAAFAMRGCNFAYGNLANTYLVGCTLSECRLLEACFDYCDLTNADLSGSELHNISASGVTVVGADLRGASFNNLNPRDVDLHGAKIYFSQLSMLLDPLGVIVEDDR